MNSPSGADRIADLTARGRLAEFHGCPTLGHSEESDVEAPPLPAAALLPAPALLPPPTHHSQQQQPSWRQPVGRPPRAQAQAIGPTGLTVSIPTISPAAGKVVRLPARPPTHLYAPVHETPSTAREPLLTPPMTPTAMAPTALEGLQPPLRSPRMRAAAVSRGAPEWVSAPSPRPLRERVAVFRSLADANTVVAVYHSPTERKSPGHAERRGSMLLVPLNERMEFFTRLEPATPLPPSGCDVDSIKADAERAREAAEEERLAREREREARQRLMRVQITHAHWSARSLDPTDATAKSIAIMYGLVCGVLGWVVGHAAAYTWAATATLAASLAVAMSAWRWPPEPPKPAVTQTKWSDPRSRTWLERAKAHRQQRDAAMATRVQKIFRGHAARASGTASAPEPGAGATGKKRLAIVGSRWRHLQRLRRPIKLVRVLVHETTSALDRLLDAIDRAKTSASDAMAQRMSTIPCLVVMAMYRPRLQRLSHSTHTHAARARLPLGSVQPLMLFSLPL